MKIRNLNVVLKNENKQGECPIQIWYTNKHKDIVQILPLSRKEKRKMRRQERRAAKNE